MSTPTSYAEFLAALIAARKAKGLERIQVAQLIGMTRGAVDSWERGYRTPARENAQRWADALGVDLPADTAGWFSRATRNRVARHGTRGGAQRHRRNHEVVCRPCLDAESAYAAGRRAARATAA